MSIEIYTDGACLGNPGAGGWAFVVYSDQKEKYYCAEGVADTTNNRMELYAAIMACEYALLTRTYQPNKNTLVSEDHMIPEEEKITVFTDSQYVQKGITEWCPNWKKNQWRGSKGPVKNVDLWQRLDQVYAQGHVRWAWVKGHSGNIGNERADTLATSEAKKIQHLNTVGSKKPSVTPPSKTYLAVPFSEKEEAKDLGAKWDSVAKKWYVDRPDHQCQKWLP